MSLSIGDTVGDYRILEEIGRGGIGRVFKVEHTVTRRLEAMKILAGGRPDVAHTGRGPCARFNFRQAWTIPTSPPCTTRSGREKI